MKHVLVLASLILAILCNSTSGAANKYLQKNVYEEKDCTGATVWTIVTLNICTATATTTSDPIQKYGISNCTEEGVSTLYCDDANCTNCTSSSRNSCYLQQGGSSNYECVDTIPPPPQGSFVQERYEGPDCGGRALSFQSYAKDFCVAGDQVSTLYVCDDDGFLNVVTCLDSGSCNVSCTAGPQNTGCTNVQDPTIAGNSLKISCTSGDAIKTTGSSTSTSSSSPVDVTTTTTTTTGDATLTSASATTTTDSATLTTQGIFNTTTGVSTTTAISMATTTTTTIAATTTTATTGSILDRTLIIVVVDPTPNSVNLTWELAGTNKKRNEFFFVVELLGDSDSNSYVVYNGTETSCVVKSLQPQTSYIVDIYYYIDEVLHAFSAKNFSTPPLSPASTSAPIVADGGRDGTNTGIIAGLVVGLFLGILLIVLLVFFLVIKKRKLKNSMSQEFDYGAPTTSRRRATIGLAAIGTGYSMRDLRANMTSSSSNSSQGTQSSPTMTSSQEMSTRSELSETQEIGPPPPGDTQNDILLEQ